MKKSAVFVSQDVMRRDLAVATFRSVLESPAGLAVALLWMIAAMSWRALTTLHRNHANQLHCLEQDILELAQDGDLAGQLTGPSDSAGADETTGLREAVNGLIRRIGDNDQNLRTQITDLGVKCATAEDASRQRSEVLATVSHEIRTSLNGVLAMAEVMGADELGSLQRERLHMIRQSGEAIQSILDDVLDLVRIGSGDLTLETRAFSPAHLVEATVAAFRPAAASRGLMLQVRISPDAERMRIGDPARIRQILNNLISNSLKFTAAGRIKVSVGVVGEDLLLSVADTGVGVPPDRIPDLFQKTGAGRTSTLGARDGSGLGLPISKDICTLMGGRIWIETDRPLGAAVHVALPLALAPTQAAKAMTAETQALQGPEPKQGLMDGAPAPVAPDAGNQSTLRILAAEDNTANRLVLEAMIGILGFDMEIVGDGREAIDAWEVNDYDLILMDIQMPVMDGLSATREIRTRELATGRFRTPIVAVSANVMSHQVSEYMAAGMDGHVPKPIDLQRLHRAIVDAITNNAEVAEREGAPPETQNEQRSMAN